MSPRASAPIAALKNVTLSIIARRGARDLRRERRRQEHAGEDPDRRHPADGGIVLVAASRMRSRRRARAGARHRPGRAGAEPLRRSFRSLDNIWLGNRARCRSFTRRADCASGRARRSTVLGLGDLPLDTPVGRLTIGRAPTGRDRPHADARRARAHPRRADRDAVRRRDRAHLQRAPGAEGRRQVGHLHHPSARRGVPDLRHRHGAAQRRAGRDAAGHRPRPRAR